MTDECYPSPGGMQASVPRIARILSCNPNVATEICVLSPSTSSRDSSWQSDLTVHWLSDDWYSAAQPLLDPSTRKPLIGANREEISRLTFLVLRNHIQRRLDQRPSDKHLILSFYLTNVGFAAQQVSLVLGMPHIAAIRGSDYSRGFFDPETIAVVEYVLRSSNHIVATNNQQKTCIERFFGIQGKVSVIYNSQSHIPRPWSRSGEAHIQLFSDSGYSHKKGTHILLEAFKTLKADGLPVRLTVVGRTKTSEREFWENNRKQFECLYPDDVAFFDYRPTAEIETFLYNADIFCSATLGEGCSQARMRALLTGMPVVTTMCGEILDLAQSLPTCYAAPCGDLNGYATALRKACAEVISNRTNSTAAVRSHMKKVFSEERECMLWKQVIENVTHAAEYSGDKYPPRVLLYVHEGKGLGHLRRVSTIASVLQDTCSTLIVSGHRELGWLPKPDCEFVHIPSLEGIDHDYLEYNGRRPFLPGGAYRAMAVRKAIIEATVKAFRPDAIVLDYLPFGNDGEMMEVLKTTKCRKYLILRGVVDDEEKANEEVFFDTASLIRLYDRIFVACDPTVIDIECEYGLDSLLAKKLAYVGYVCEPPLPEDRFKMRIKKGVQENEKWVVCSSGGGKKSDGFLAACIEAARHFPEVHFDVVAGPRLSTDSLKNISLDAPSNVVITKQIIELPLWHAACDVLVSHGGYNSMIEGVSAGVPVVVLPSPEEAERISHAKRLETLGAVKVADNAGDLHSKLKELLSGMAREHSPAVSTTGAEVIAEWIYCDLTNQSRAEHEREHSQLISKNGRLCH